VIVVCPGMVAASSGKNKKKKKKTDAPVGFMD